VFVERRNRRRRRAVGISPGVRPATGLDRRFPRASTCPAIRFWCGAARFRPVGTVDRHPAKLAQPKAPGKTSFVNSTLVSTTGEYMGKFPEASQQADALGAQLVVKLQQTAGINRNPRAEFN
jgi:hypothetical protein